MLLLTVWWPDIHVFVPANIHLPSAIVFGAGPIDGNGSVCDIHFGNLFPPLHVNNLDPSVGSKFGETGQDLAHDMLWGLSMKNNYGDAVIHSHDQILLHECIRQFCFVFPFLFIYLLIYLILYLHVCLSLCSCSYSSCGDSTRFTGRQQYKNDYKPCICQRVCLYVRTPALSHFTFLCPSILESYQTSHIT